MVPSVIKIGKEQLNMLAYADDIVLTLSVCAEYMYSTASRASCPDGVLVLCDFHKVVK
jgi:hypothetical protein